MIKQSKILVTNSSWRLECYTPDPGKIFILVGMTLKGLKKIIFFSWTLKFVDFVFSKKGICPG